MARRLAQLLALALLAVASLGAKCGKGPGIQASVGLLPEQVTVGVGSSFFLDLRLETNRPIQAYDLVLSYDDSLVAPASQGPNAEFDDDGLFFKTEWAGPTVQLVDVRHGAASSTGNLLVARVEFDALASGALSVSITGEVADELGAAVPLTGSGTAQVTITP